MHFPATPHWVWKNPAQSTDWIARAAAFIIAISCAANMLLIWVSRDNDAFQWEITVAAGLAGAGMFYRSFIRRNVVTMYACLLACGMWAANGVEIALTDGVLLSGKFRNGGFYLTFGLLAGLFYLVERVGSHTDATQVEKVGEILDVVGVEHDINPDDVVHEVAVAIEAAAPTEPVEAGDGPR